MTVGAPPDIRFDAVGLIPAVVQDIRSRRVLMVGYMNRESLDLTLSSGMVWFYSRSRASLWQKGSTSGNTLSLVRLTLDCDGDTLLVEVEPAGPTCHTGEISCFQHLLAGEVTVDAASTAAELLRVIKQRHLERSADSYVSKLFNGGVDRIAKKIGEEAGEVIIAAKNDNPTEIANEVADLWFHCYVLLVHLGVEPDTVWEVLAGRRR